MDRFIGLCSGNLAPPRRCAGNIYIRQGLAFNAFFQKFRKIEIFFADNRKNGILEDVYGQDIFLQPRRFGIARDHPDIRQPHDCIRRALARAAGIPTRMAAGIVYMESGFYYHAWPEVWLGTWTAIDPTFSQFPADATHIRFVTGNLDRQAEIFRLVGKLKVEVLEYK